MANNGYQQYGGNPFGNTEGGYSGSSPYGRTNENIGVASSNPYGSTGDYQSPAPPPLTHEESNYSQPSQNATTSGAQYGADPEASVPPLQPHGRSIMSQQEFLQRVDGVKSSINNLTTSISSIATIHQRILSSADSGPSSQLESIITQTQIQNTAIKNEIKNLETDAARDASNGLKKSQVESLKRTFRDQLREYEKEERAYGQRYREAIARQYRIVNPEATEQEVEEAAHADWGNEGIFQSALKTNRSALANSVLGNVRARHNDILRIEKTLVELAQLFEQLNEAVTIQGEMVDHVAEKAEDVHQDTEIANAQIVKGIKSARRRQKMKWWLVLVIVLIIAVLALVLGLYFGLKKK